MSIVPIFWGQPKIAMHKNTKITPVMRKEIFKQWQTGSYSHRKLASLYHVDKRVIGRIIQRGKLGDFSVHTSVNHRYLIQTDSQEKERLTSGQKKRKG